MNAQKATKLKQVLNRQRKNVLIKMATWDRRPCVLAAAGWQPLEVAISCRLHHCAVCLLRLGRAVPAACSFARLRLAASSASNPLARFALHGLAFPVYMSCADTTKRVLDMLRGWSPGRHRLHHVASQSQTVTRATRSTFFLDLRCVFCFQHLWPWCWAKQVSNPA